MDEAKLLELARAACGAAGKAGSNHADAFVQESRGVSVEIEKNSIRTGDVEYEAGYCIRAFNKGGAGFSRGSGFDEGQIVEAGADACDMARECEADPDFKDLPHPDAAEDVDMLYSDEVAGFSAAKAIEWGTRCIDASKEIEPEVIMKGGFSSGASASALANTNGVSTTNRSSFISFYVFSVVRRGDKVGSYYEYTHARRLDDLMSPEEVAGEATRKAVSFVGSRKMESGEYPVVLGPLAAQGFIRSIIDASSAEEIQRGRSYLMEKRGKKIAPELLTVKEDPLVPAGLYSDPADGEGTPRRKRALIDSGSLTTYLHNSYTANKSGEENTGHASRGSFNSNVGTGATNLVIVPGETQEKDIISNIKDGLYIFMGSISPNIVTGQISGTVDFGFRISNGELAYPVENVMVGGDVFEFLSKLDVISSDYREEAGNISPSLLLGKIRVASA